MNNLTWTRLLKPYSKIVIGPNPAKIMGPEDMGQFDAFVNLTLSSNKIKTKAKQYWIPVRETSPWGFEPFERSKQILDFHYERGDSVYLYCKNGINRSPCISMAWLLSKGHNLEEAAMIISEGCGIMVELNREVFQYNILKGYIPSLPKKS